LGLREHHRGGRVPTQELPPDRLPKRLAEHAMGAMDGPAAEPAGTHGVVDRLGSVIEISTASSGDIEVSVGRALSRAWSRIDHREYFRESGQLRVWLHDVLLPILSDARRDPEYRKSQNLDPTPTPVPLAPKSVQESNRRGSWLLLLAVLSGLAIWYIASR